jgi:hypothetical protein
MQLTYSNPIPQGKTEKRRTTAHQKEKERERTTEPKQLRFT